MSGIMKNWRRPFRGPSSGKNRKPRSPVPFRLLVPNQAGLIGLAVYAQGALIDGNRVGVTDAAEFHIGN